LDKNYQGLAWFNFTLWIKVTGGYLGLILHFG